jgi:hypothetical protein
MASITGLFRSDIQPQLTHAGNLITFQEQWYLQLDANATEVEADSLLNALTTGNAYSWPAIGEDSHPDNSALYPTGWTVNRDDHLLSKFTINLSYTNNIDVINQSQRAIDADPVYNYQNVDTIIEVDIDPIEGKAIAASNGEAYFPKVQRKGTNKRITINRNETQYDPNRALDYENKLNSQALRIDGRYYDPRTLILESWTGKSAIDVDGSDYYQVTYQFLYDNETHQIELIDAASGPDLNGTHPQLYRLTEGKSHKLDGAGVYLGRSEQNDPNTYSTNAFWVHEEIDMRILRL